VYVVTLPVLKVVGVTWNNVQSFCFHECYSLGDVA
jgi:hypothetical protein